MNKGIRLLLPDATPRKVQFHPTKKPGRKAGTAERTERLEIRCTPELLQAIEILKGGRDKGVLSNYKTAADIIHVAVARYLRFCSIGYPEHVKQICDKLDDI